jgi:hypothetical protein
LRDPLRVRRSLIFRHVTKIPTRTWVRLERTLCSAVHRGDPHPRMGATLRLTP